MWLYKLIIICVILSRNVIREMVCVKKIMVLAVLIMTLVVSCSYLEEAEKEQRERGVECRYGKRGGLENCRYIN